MKKTIKLITIFVITLALISCASTQNKHYKLWNSYKSCSAYGNP